jgi:phosphate transport system ATP-binding protein
VRACTPDVLLQGDEVLELAGITFETVSVPGHSPGHLAFAADGALFSGDVLFDGRNIYSEKIDPVLLRRKVGMVFQQPNPFPRMSAFANVAVGLRFNGKKRSRSEIAESVEKSLRMAALWDELKDHLDRPGTSLSGGQQQRLCIARALAVEPEVLLMDEPCSALDPVSTAKIEELIEDLSDKYSIVVVTHNMQQAGRIADYVAFFLLGDLIEMDKAARIFTNPADKRTEEYITALEFVRMLAENHLDK